MDIGSASSARALIIFYGIILVAFIVRLRQTGRSKSIPGTAISLGITFTFVGIFIALLGFDTGNIQESIPQLLDGMRLAFATSILGMVTAVLYRVAPNAGLWVREKNRVEAERADVATIDQLNAQQERRHKELRVALRIVH